MSENKKQIKCNFYAGDGKANFSVERIAKQGDEVRDKYIIKGYPLLFNNPAKIYNSMFDESKGEYIQVEAEEKISPDAFKNTNLDGRIYLLLQHDWHKPLGVTGRNLKLQIEDGVGVFITCELSNTQMARDTFNDIENGILDSMSFGAFVEYERDDKGNITYTNIVELEEVSIVTRPQFYEASVITASKNVVKSIEKEVKEKDGNLQFNKLLNKIKEI